MMEPIARGPRRFSGTVAVIAAVAALGLSAYYSWIALGVGAIAVFAFVLGLALSRRSVVTGGAGLLLVAVLAAGVGGAPPIPLLAAVIVALLAWDVAGSAIVLGRQLGTEAGALRLEVTHVASTGIVGIIAAGAGMALFLIGTGHQPVVALVLLVVAAIFLVESMA